MAAIIADLIQETSTSTGTGNITVAGAVTGYRSFTSVCVIGDTFYGMIVAVDSTGVPTGQWEAGIYTYSAANTIARTTVTASSSSNAAINFSAGTKRVYIEATASQIAAFQSAIQPNTAVPYGQTSGNFTSPILADEFNGATLDATGWNDFFFASTSDSLINYSVANGALNIWPGSTYIARHITTDTKYYTYSGIYLEIEAQMPIGDGTSANCWLTGRDTGTNTQLEFCKTFGGGTPSSSNPGYADATYHPIDYRCSVWNDSGAAVTSQFKASASITVPDLSAAFHKYAVKIETDGITFYFDGVQVGSKVTTSSFSRRMYLLFTLGFNEAGSGTTATARTPTGITNAMKINYIRAWQVK